MGQLAVVIPEKIYFKIGEVCELVGVQAHVLRYWETEFPMLSPQKNRSGQRSYRRRDVEIALRIKQLLYDEMFTIAGAKKKLQSDAREGSKSKSAVSQAAKEPAETAARTEKRVEAPTLFDTEPEANSEVVGSNGHAPVSANEYSPQQRDAIKVVAEHLLELRDLLRNRPA